MTTLFARTCSAAALALAAVAVPVPAQADPSEFQMWGSSGRWRIISAPGMCSAGVPDKDQNASLMVSIFDGSGRYISVSRTVPSLPKEIVVVLTMADGGQVRIPSQWNAEFKDGLHDVMGNQSLKPEETDALRGASTLSVEGLPGYEPVTFAPGEVDALLDSLDRCMRMQK